MYPLLGMFQGHYNSGSDCNSGDCGIYNSGSDCYSGNCGMQCQPQQQCCQMQMPCQQMVQPMVQPTVASQPRPSIAYSYGYPSTGEIKINDNELMLSMDV